MTVTNLQLLLTIGIPSILLVLSWISKNTRLAAHDKRFDEVEKRFDLVNQRFDSVGDRFDVVISSQNKYALEIMRNMTALHERVAVVEARQAR